MGWTVKSHVFLAAAARIAVLVGVLLVGVLLIPPAAFAGVLDDAKAAGQIGETPDGFIAAVAEPPSAAIAALIQDINSQRLDRYREIARDTGSTVEQVRALVGQRLIGEALSGTYIMGSDGVWVRVR